MRLLRHWVVWFVCCIVNAHGANIDVDAGVVITPASALITRWRDVDFTAGVINARALDVTTPTRDVFAPTSTFNVDVRALTALASTLNTQAMNVIARR